MSLEDIVELAHSRWIIERFYQDARGKAGAGCGSEASRSALSATGFYSSSQQNSAAFGMTVGGVM